MVTVLCCHVGAIQANTAEALAKYAPPVDYVNVAGDPFAYGKAIASRWSKGSDLVIIEPDNEITAEVIPSFTECSQPWCTYAYEIFAPPWTRMCDTCLGCVRFSAELQRKFDFEYHVLREPCETCNTPHATYGELDCRIAHLLTKLYGLSPHVHGEVRHLHPYQAVEAGAIGARQPAIDFIGGFKRREGT